MNSKIATMPIINRFAELLDKKQKADGRYISLVEVELKTVSQDEPYINGRKIR